jgi:hypothetical protein
VTVLTQLLDVEFISLTCEVVGVSYKDESLVVAKTQYKQRETVRGIRDPCRSNLSVETDAGSWQGATALRKLQTYGFL